MMKVWMHLIITAFEAHKSAEPTGMMFGLIFLFVLNAIYFSPVLAKTHTKTCRIKKEAR